MKPLKTRGRPKQIILINRDLQFRYVRVALLVGLISTLLSFMVILVPLFQFEILRIPRFLPWPIMLGMGFAVVINMVCVVFMTVVISHRIAGPIFALSREFSELSQGVFGRQLKSRKHDDLQYLVRYFNDMSLCLKNLSYDDYEAVSGFLDLAQSLHQKCEQISVSETQNSELLSLRSDVEALCEQLKTHSAQILARTGEDSSALSESTSRDRLS